MRIISCASYYGTGSSAITDLLSEYDNCYSLTNHEIRFVHDPEGISDLEYNLVENQNRHNSGHALKRFKKRVDFWGGNKIIKKYEPFFQWKWREISYEYINELTDFSYNGYWHQDVIDRGNIFYFRKRLLSKIIQKTVFLSNSERGLSELPNEITLCSHPSEEKFLECTRKYIDNLFEVANVGKKENIIVDQIVPPSNLKRYVRYFNNIKVIIVDRDPRDLYLLEKYIWKGTVIPTKSVETFCRWFLYTRDHRKKESVNNDKVLFIQFEDLIYNYDDSIRKIELFLGFNEGNHKNIGVSFNPNVSIKNTKLWERIKECDSDVKYIEKELAEYIYDYSKVK